MPLMTTSRPESRSASRRRQDARLLRDLLRAEVLRGGLVGGLLPSEGALMAEYDASRATVREALDLLRQAGLVERLKGAGTLAVTQRYAMRLVEAHGVVEQLEQVDQVTGFSSRVLEMRVVPMPVPVAAHLDEEPGSDCLLVEYVGYHRGRLVGLCTNYVRFPEASSIQAVDFDRHWYTLLADAGLTVGQTAFRIEVTTADALLAPLLEVPVGAPVLAMEQTIRDTADRCYDFAILRMRADALALLGTVSRDGVLVSGA